MRTLAFATAITLLLVSPPSIAQTGDDKALALSLFADGRSLKAQGKFEEAAQKFEAAAGSMRSYGILLNLAQCYEKLGRTASAWSTWGEAKAIAGNAKDQTDAMNAEQALVSHLSLLAIVVPQGAVRDNLTVLRDGTVIRAPAWGKASPVDPGPHTIEARAPGYKSWSTTLEIGKDADQRTVTMPPLEPEEARAAAPPVAPAGFPAPPATPVESPPATPVAPPPEVTTAAPGDGPDSGPARHTGSTQRIVGVSIITAGALAATVGLAEYLGGNSKINKAAETATTANNQHDKPLYETAQPQLNNGVSQRNLGGVLLGVGGTAIAGGLVTLLLAPSAPQTNAASPVAPWIGVRAAGLSWLGHW